MAKSNKTLGNPIGDPEIISYIEKCLIEKLTYLVKGFKRYLIK